MVARSPVASGFSRPMTVKSLAATGIVVTAFGAAACGGPSRTPPAPVADVSPVTGRSWLAQVSLDPETSQLGRLGGMDRPPDTARREPMPRFPSWGGRLVQSLRSLFGRPSESWAAASEPFVLAGADLYRLECQSCHGPSGLGSPPEVNSLIGPVEGTSAALLMQRLEEKGTPVDEEFAQDIVSGAADDLRKRLDEGGEKMPPFARLHDDERGALMGHLERLASLPEAPETPELVTVPMLRVGEHLVKGTCHTCHDAAGPYGGRMAVMMSDEVPPLSAFTVDYSVDEIVTKVRTGASGQMSRMMGRREDRMPVFSYLTHEEIAAAVAYLAAVPPQP